MGHLTALKQHLASEPEHEACPYGTKSSVPALVYIHMHMQLPKGFTHLHLRIEMTLVSGFSWYVVLVATQESTNL